MTLFRLDASIRTDGSTSRALGDIVEAEWSAVHAGSAVTRRHVGTEPVPAGAWGDAVAASATSESARTHDQAVATAWRAN
jgi:FMN-dependent NADH-azoreductase